MATLSQEQRTQLLLIARESIAAALAGRRYQVPPEYIDERLSQPAGAFVTLNTPAGDLRGCIGSIVPVAPLYQAVSDSAVNAATRDPRFHPVSRQELQGLHLEISVMGPIEAVSSVNDIEVGRDGLIISRGRFAGLLLPQVATEYGWDREAFLSHTCQKAGLPPDSWKDPGTRIERFSAEVFGELTA
jgi:uncharacterized protein